jgi:hypothetical protein
VKSASQRIAGLSVVCLFVLGASATQRVPKRKPPPPKPTLFMEAEAVDGAPREAGPECKSWGSLERVHGPVPSGRQRLVVMELKGDRSVPFKMLEDAMTMRAAEYCADGISVLRAVAEPGADLFSEMKAVGWRRPPPQAEVEDGDEEEGRSEEEGTDQEEGGGKEGAGEEEDFYE